MKAKTDYRKDTTLTVLLDKRLKEAFFYACEERQLAPQAILRRLIDDLLTKELGITKLEIYGAEEEGAA